jgi:hypothetical protein
LFWPAGEDEAGRDSGPEPQDADLVLEPQAEDDSEDDPLPGSGSFVEEDVREQIRGESPDQQVQGVHGEVVVEAHLHGSAQCREHRHLLREPSAAHAPGQQANKQHCERPRERRDEANRDERPAEHRRPHLQYQDRERRMVDISESRMIRARQIVELVAKVSVTARRRQVKEELQGRQDEQEGVEALRRGGGDGAGPERVRFIGHGGWRLAQPPGCRPAAVVS